MWIRVLTESDIVIGDVLSFDYTTEKWTKATSLVSPLGVAKTNALLEKNSTNKYTVEIQSTSPLIKSASRSIPNEGGELNVENGEVFVDNNADHEGIIVPNFIGAADRVAGDLVAIVIR